MNQTPPSAQQPVVNGVMFGRACITHSGPISASSAARSSVPPGPTLAIRIPPAMLQALHRNGGAALTSTVLYYEKAALVVLYVRAGRYLAAVLADLGDAEMSRFTADAVAVDALRIALVTDHEVAVTASPLPAALRKVLVEPSRRSPARLAILAGAASYSISMLGDDAHLKSAHIDPRRLKGKSLHVHIGSNAVGASDDTEPRRPDTMQ